MGIHGRGIGRPEWGVRVPADKEGFCAVEGIAAEMKN